MACQRVNQQRPSGQPPLRLQVFQRIALQRFGVSGSRRSRFTHAQGLTGYVKRLDSQLRDQRFSRSVTARSKPSHQLRPQRQARPIRPPDPVHGLFALWAGGSRNARGAVRASDIAFTANAAHDGMTEVERSLFGGNYGLNGSGGEFYQFAGLILESAAATDVGTV